MCPGAEWKMNGKGVRGCWGLGVVTKPRDSISERSRFWDRGTKGMQGRQARGVLHVKGASVCMEGQEMVGLRFLKVSSWWLKGKCW